MYFNKDNYSIYYKKYGENNSNIIILPGWGDTRNTFDFIINELSKKYTVYIFDYPGFGRSIFPDNDLTIYDYTNIIRDFIKDKNIVNPTIIAHSFGGRIATLLSGYYKDDINKLILIDIAGIKPKKNIFKLLKQTLYKILRKLKFLIPKRKRNIYLKKLLLLFGSSDYKVLNNNMQKTFRNIVNEDLKFYYKSIKQKTLLIWGQKDKSTPLKDAYYIKENIKNSKLIIYPKVGHFSYLDSPILTTELIINFIENK